MRARGGGGGGRALAADGAAAAAMRMQQALAGKTLPVSETLGLGVTASCGIASWQDGETLAALTSRADQALYRAKSEGRNRAVIADAPSGPNKTAASH